MVDLVKGKQTTNLTNTSFNRSQCRAKQYDVDDYSITLGDNL